MSTDSHARLQRALDLLLKRKQSRSAKINREWARVRRENQHWLGDSGVTGIGVASKVSRDTDIGELAIRVFVSEKANVTCESPSWIPPTLRLPGVSNVVPIDVVEAGSLIPQNAICGDAISEERRTSWGTLGCLVEAEGELSGQLLALTCNHVLPGATGAQVDWLGFPGSHDAKRFRLGHVLQRSSLRPASASERYPNRYEVAFVTVSELAAHDAIREIGPPVGLRVSPPAVGESLRLWGAKSGFCKGLVTHVNQNHMLSIGGVDYGFQGLVHHSATTDEGDSGAAVLDAQNRIVGLHMGHVSCAAIMMPIGSIVRRYGLRLPSLADGRLLADAALVPTDDRGLAIDVLARTIWGEARGEPMEGREAVASVVVNRARRRRKHFGLTVEDVCRKPWQFSCWNSNDPNRRRLLEVSLADAVFRHCLDIARRAVSGTLADRTAGSTHYHHEAIAPVWSRGHSPVTQIGRHRFYNDVA